MPTLKYLDRTFDCAVAIKGADYIHLLDENNVMTAAFDNITDFSDYTLENGSYTAPTAEGYCKVAVLRDDGTIGAGDHTCADIGTAMTNAQAAGAKAQQALDAANAGYSNQEILTPATASLYGLGEDAVPDDVLGVLGAYKQHWWKRRSVAYYPAYYVTGELGTQTVVTAGSSVNQVFKRGSSVGVTNDGTIELLETTTNASGFTDEASDFSGLKGYYVQHNNGGDVFYIPSDATITSQQNSSSSYSILATGNLITGYAERYEYGEWEYIQASDRNTYPDSGVSGGYEYDYLGVPLENSSVPVKIEVGSYTGSGVYGEGNENTLTFSFVPKIVIIRRQSIVQPTIFINSIKRGYTWTGQCGGGEYTAFWNGRTLSWYGGDSDRWYSNNSSSNNTEASGQLNVAGETYHYVAIG